MFPLCALLTTEGEVVEVVDVGLLNQHAGPDFFNAKIRIGGTMWAGNVEIHLRSSDWYRHGHDTDEAYNNVILHVASVVDCPVRTASGKTLPQLQLDIPAQVQARYDELRTIKDYPRCHKIIRGLDTLTVHSWMDTLLSERLSARSATIQKRLGDYGSDWERTLFVTLSRNFGFGLNGDAFEAWARLIPLEKLGKHRDELFQIEAIFLGMAGLLAEEGNTDGYMERLRKEFAYQSRLYSLPAPIDNTLWKYLRLRPQNFPHIRLAELAWMYSKGKVGLAALLDCARDERPVEALCDALSATASDYWTTHIMPGKEVRKRKLSLSLGTRHLLIINTVVPVLFAYATTHGDDALRERLYNIIHSLPAENNSILRMWHECGLNVDTAADSQALIQLKKEYCDSIDCLRCRFGYEYLKTTAAI